jgi:hypothetical protein
MGHDFPGYSPHSELAATGDYDMPGDLANK